MTTSMWDKTIEDFFLNYQKWWKNEWKEEYQKKLYFYLKLKYKDNKVVEEEYDNIMLRAEKHMQSKGIDLQKKVKDEQMAKLKNAKTGVPITIETAYGIVGPNGEDDGKRFIHKKDADGYAKGIHKEPDFVVFNDKPK